MNVVQGKIQFQDVDPRLAQEAHVAGLRVGLNTVWITSSE